MALETGSHIPELDSNNPLGSDNVSLGDDHIRLIKRCTKGSFPNFEGTDAIPKQVDLTEDQLNDAALKSEAQTISGAWNHTDVLQIANAKEIQARDFADAVWHRMIELTAADLMVVGDQLVDMRLSGLASIEARINNNAKAQILDNALGSLLVKDMVGEFKKAGFRNPTRTTLAVDATSIQDWEGQIINITAPNVALTIGSLEAGTAYMIMCTDGPTTLSKGPNTTFRFLDGHGGLVSADGATLVEGSIIEIWHHGGAQVNIWGNGYNPL